MLERVFLSYSLEDVDWVRQLHSDLLAKLRQPGDSKLVYFAPSHNRDGSLWEKAVWEALDQSPVFLPVVTRFSAESAWVKREVARAIDMWRRDKRRIIIPLMLTADHNCLAKIHPDLETFQFIDCFPPDDSDTYARVLSLLVGDLKRLDDIRRGRPVNSRPSIWRRIARFIGNVLLRW